MAPRALGNALFGRSDRRTGVTLALAFGLLVGTHWVLTGTGATGESLDRWLSEGLNFLWLVSILFVLAATNAIVNDGLPASVALAVGPITGFLLSNMGFPHEPTTLQVWAAALEGGLFYGIPTGVAGYLLGRGLDRLHGRRSGPRSGPRNGGVDGPPRGNG